MAFARRDWGLNKTAGQSFIAGLRATAPFRHGFCKTSSPAKLLEWRSDMVEA
jgi:hypothetical protein